MKTRRVHRGPTSRDLSRLVLARATARMAIERANGVYAEAILDTFRGEIGATVRGVSPLLLALLEQERVPLDDLAWQLRPAEGWPYRPRLPAGEVVFKATKDQLPPNVTSAARVGRPFGTLVAEWHSVLIGNQAGDTIAVHVVDHSIEVAARLGGVLLTTLFGTTMIDVPNMTLARMPAARAGRPLEEALPLPALRGRGWVVTKAFDGDVSDDVEITAETGSRRYRLPWAR